jgi:hypothetical protein
VGLLALELWDSLLGLFVVGTPPALQAAETLSPLFEPGIDAGPAKPVNFRKAQSFIRY